MAQIPTPRYTPHQLDKQTRIEIYKEFNGGRMLQRSQIGAYRDRVYRATGMKVCKRESEAKYYSRNTKPKDFLKYYLHNTNIHACKPSQTLCLLAIDSSMNHNNTNYN